ncbi:MAG TPA: extensin family protein [Stellaceae bacterium]|jgi:hypothetical protein
MRQATATALAVALALVGSAYLVGRFAPPRFSPLAPLDIADESVPLVTAVKLARVRADPAYCRAALATSSFAVTPVAEMSSRQGCTLHDVERIAAGRDPAFNSGFVATCPLAVDLAMLVEHVIAPAAARDMHSGVVRIDQLGTFACRPIVGDGATTEMSQHASANAIDIAGFVFADGEKATVAVDWRGDDARARFIHDVHDGACGIFPVVLSPDYNTAHWNHLHLDLSGFHFCR